MQPHIKIKVKVKIPMPSVSQAEQRATAIALHHPDKLYKRNKGLLKMGKMALREFASTARKFLPKKVKAA